MHLRIDVPRVGGIRFTKVSDRGFPDRLLRQELGQAPPGVSGVRIECEDLAIVLDSGPLVSEPGEDLREMRVRRFVLRLQLDRPGKMEPRAIELSGFDRDETELQVAGGPVGFFTNQGLGQLPGLAIGLPATSFSSR